MIDFKKMNLFNDERTNLNKNSSHYDDDDDDDDDDDSIVYKKRSQKVKLF
jgi:hypothetical protein